MWLLVIIDTSATFMYVFTVLLFYLYKFAFWNEKTDLMLGKQTVSFYVFYYNYSTLHKKVNIF